MRKIETVGDVAAWRMCLGCGACAYACPTENVSLVNILEEGIRPVLTSAKCSDCNVCLSVCPAWENDHRPLLNRSGAIKELRESCGPVLEIWEGHATDPEIRYMGSSGGVLTAIAAYCLEKVGMSGVLHIGADPHDPTKNRTRLSHSRNELLEFTGSRYAPASACDRLDLIENAPTPCVFIGQPAEVTALRKCASINERLASKVGIALSFFCAGSPSTRGTLELLRRLNVPVDTLKSVRYRGRGWPGMFATEKIDGTGAEHLTYRQSWSFLQSYRPLSTHIAPDGSGEDADITCGDPWYREPEAGALGSSLIVVRTELGRQILNAALREGYITATRSEPARLIASQRNLINKRGAIWGRILALHLLGIPTPRLRGFHLFSCWWRHLSIADKLRSLFGTIKRALKRGYCRRLVIRPRVEQT